MVSTTAPSDARCHGGSSDLILKPLGYENISFLQLVLLQQSLVLLVNELPAL